MPEKGRKKDTKKRESRGRTEKWFRIAVVLLAVLILAVGGYGLLQISGETEKDGAEMASGEQEEGAPPELLSVVIGDTQAQIESAEEDGETVWYIKAALPADFPFERTTLNLELSPGAAVSDESSSLITELGGRPVVNLTVENADLIITDGTVSREYRFLLDVAPSE